MRRREIWSGLVRWWGFRRRMRARVRRLRERWREEASDAAMVTEALHDAIDEAERQRAEIEQLTEELRQAKRLLDASEARADVLDTQLELMSQYVVKWQTRMQREAAIDAARIERSKRGVFAQDDEG